MIVGVVGAEGAKFTASGEAEARCAIIDAIAGAELVVSGACHLGGVDVWAIEEARRAGIHTREYPPRVLNWSQGYKPRNIEIATAADVLLNITVARLPSAYSGMRFKLCYHCGMAEHIKSGGCWTAKYAERLGKHAVRITVENAE